MANARRLPGIQVDVAPPLAAEALPRLDVAVFVGFASTGPLHLPVALESAAQYATAFGADAPLAWDERRGERVHAHLGPSVRAFFANGGRRCWVIRVARSAAMERVRAEVDPNADPELAVAVANRFALSGMLSIAAARGEAEPAIVAARCEGSWSDSLRASVSVQSRGFALDAWSGVDSPASGQYQFLTRQPLRNGDLLQFGRPIGDCAYARVDAVAAGPTPASPYRVSVRMLAAFERILADASPAGDVAGVARLAGVELPLTATLLAPPAFDEDPESAAEPPPLSLRFDQALPESAFEIGAWVRFDAAGAVHWLRIDEADRAPDLSASPPTATTLQVLATVHGPAWREVEPAAAPFGTVSSAQVLEIELRATTDQGPQARLRQLGLTPERPGNFWELQRDGDFYRVHDDLAVAAPAQLQRFPLAPDEAPLPLAWLPLGASGLFGAAVGPLHREHTALERDGLAVFDAGLFLDPQLADDGVDALLSHADDIRLIRERTRPLYGLHAVFGIGAGGLFNEASLIAVPDAIHSGWQRRGEDQSQPAQAPPSATPAHWRAHRGACLATVAADSVLPAPDFGRFLDCSTRLIEAPLLDGPDAPVPPGTYRLSWTESEPGAVYALFEAGSADFSDEREIYRGADGEYVAMSQREGLYHYRVFAWVGDESSQGSNPVAVRVRADDWEQLAPESAGDLHETDWLQVHRASLRLAAACGDLFAVLSMPRHFRTAQALRYTQRLRAVRTPTDQVEPGDPQALGFDEARALSYGALYFPWLQSDARASGADRTGQRPLRVVPPDGVAVGVLAKRASLRGAWIAAANEPMKDVVALTPPITESDRQALQDAQINLLRNDPRGFFALSADTLALDEALRPINVRRLLILLRRVALRHGIRYVFEPNGPVLWRSVQRGFELLLSELFRRGAFAGATAAQSFRVVTDEGVNTPQSVDAGRFVVELRVAPSLPMRFIAVRLAQNGERLAVIEEL
ncbi:hypothetical protein [Lysobacter sp. 1R34A]|uniref:hypothetical protein n=1 Tax=Lysobacter sp. 1R34A TaxID=3445786 RepID=UPI003EEBF274